MTLKSWWDNHVQKTIASLLILIDGANVAMLEFYHQDIVRLWPAHGESLFSGLRMALAAIIGIRALRRKQASMPAPAPGTLR